MGKIVSPKEAIETSIKIRLGKKTIVVAGGVFDILHKGHIEFLKKAKREADFLFVLLESDENAREKKGETRPINPLRKRAILLSTLKFVDFVVLLPEMTKDNDYDTLMAEILPNIIATTKGDPYLSHKERQAKKIGGKIKFVTDRIGEFSTTRISRLLEN